MATKKGDDVRWVPIAGEFDTTPDGLIFRGREFIPERPATAPPPAEQPPAQTPAPQPLAGLVVSNRFATDGSLRARVSFEQISAGTTFEFVLYRDRDRRHFVSAGLGGHEWAFAIREFAPPEVPAIDNTVNIWKVHRGEGMRSFLKAGQEYDVEVRLVAGQITLLVDSVPVLSTQLAALRSSPMQVGMFCLSLHHVAISRIETNLQRPKAFVVMQFDGAFDELYNHVIREICEEFDVNPLKADEMVGPGVIIEDIVREIQSARLVVADITPANPNVYFEVGYARALGKPIILLAHKGTKLPFDVAGFRVLFYENSIGGKARLDENLRKHVAEVLR
jgi:hypothetical protein